MAVSGSTDFELDVADYVEEAFERCGLEARTGYDLKTATRSLNLMLADWANRGLNQWTIKQRTISLVKSDGEYSLDPDVIDILAVVVRRDGTDFNISRVSEKIIMLIQQENEISKKKQYLKEFSKENTWNAVNKKLRELINEY